MAWELGISQLGVVGAAARVPKTVGAPVRTQPERPVHRA